MMEASGESWEEDTAEGHVTSTTGHVTSPGVAAEKRSRGLERVRISLCLYIHKREEMRMSL